MSHIYNDKYDVYNKVNEMSTAWLACWTIITNRDITYSSLTQKYEISLYVTLFEYAHY